jgi:hypothetical protein
MKRILRSLLPLICLGFIGGAGSGGAGGGGGGLSCDAPDVAHLSLSLAGQETGQWCWAASGQMTMNFVHPASAVQQCQEVNREFPHLQSLAPPINCCSASLPRPGLCWLRGWPQYCEHGFKASRTSNRALAWNEIREQIACRKTPIAFSWHIGGGGHMMVAVGYKISRGKLKVEVVDPKNGDYNAKTMSYGPPGTTFITYNQYVGGKSLNYDHWDDFYNITYTGPRSCPAA